MKIERLILVFFIANFFPSGSFAEGNIKWQNFHGANAENGRLYKTEGTTGGASSQPILDAYQDGYIMFKAKKMSQYLAVGLSHTDPNIHWESIKYGFYFGDGDASICENGDGVAKIYAAPSDDIYKIQRVGNTIQYIWNDELVREVNCDNSLSLL